MKIKQKSVLTDYKGVKITRLTIHSPLIAEKIKPGQFIVVMVSEKGERVPLTVTDKDEQNITVIVQAAGFTTKLISQLNKGDTFYAVAGPLGKPTEIRKYGNVLCIAGGVGIAEIYPVSKAFKEENNNVTTILGVRTKATLILEKELKDVSDELYITTEDGSYRDKGFPTELLDKLLKNKDLVYIVGPVPLMKNASIITKKHNVKTLVSLNALMVDGTGMCGSCRVTVGGETKFACVDGPEFDGHLVDWDELEKRNKAYIKKENHVCNLNKLSF